MGVSTPTYYHWREKYGGMEVSDVSRLRVLEDENNRLKRAATTHLKERFKVSERRATGTAGLSSATIHYKPKARGDGPIESRMKEIAERFRRYGRPSIHVLLKREGLVMNPKKTALFTEKRTFSWASAQE